MTTVSVIPKSKPWHYIDCPHCGSQCEFRVSEFMDQKYLAKGYASTHKCSKCYKSLQHLHVQPDGSMLVTYDPQAEPWAERVLVLMRITPPGSERSIYALVDTQARTQSIEEMKSGDRSHLDYYYNEHTCPTNWFGDVEDIFGDGESDPHQLFSLAGVITMKDALVKLGRNPNEDEGFGSCIETLFPEVVEQDAIVAEKSKATYCSFAVAMQALERRTRMVIHRKDSNVYISNRDAYACAREPNVLHSYNPDDPIEMNLQWVPTREDMAATDWVIWVEPGVSF